MMKTDAEFLHLALHSYSNRQCNTVEEFNSDLNRITIIRKMIRQYLISGEISHRLILNHLVILFNVFGANAMALIMYKIESEYFSILFPFLQALNRLPLPEEMIDVDFDQTIVKELERL